MKKIYEVFRMEIGRNDACLCGSGKKYKKCCMKKAQVIEIGQVRVEQFFHRKFQLTERMKSAILPAYSFREYHALQKQFERRVKESIVDGFFHHWLLFLLSRREREAWN